MAKTGEIGGSGGINPEGGGRNVFYVYSQIKGKSQEKIKKLHTGEIILGTVLEVYSRDEISVRLPIGTFRSQINGTLMKGDTLFFKVKEVGQYLVLITYAVAVKQGSYELSSKDILRILDIPVNALFASITEFLKLKKSIIKREEILEFYDNYLSIPDKDRAGKASDDIFFTIFMIKLAHRQFDVNIFGTSYHLFTGFSIFNANLINLWNYINKAERHRKEIFNRLLSFFETDVNRIFDTSTSFFIEEKNIETSTGGLVFKERFSLYSEIKNLISDSLNSEISNSCNSIMRFLESKNTWNNSPSGMYLRYHLFKLNIDRDFHLIEFIVQKYNVLASEEKRLFPIGQSKGSSKVTQDEINEPEISSISFNMTRADYKNKIILEDYFNKVKKNNETEMRINDFINDFVKYLCNNQMSIRAIQSTYFPWREYFTTYDILGEQTTGLSVAI